MASWNFYLGSKSSRYRVASDGAPESFGDKIKFSSGHLMPIS